MLTGEVIIAICTAILACLALFTDFLNRREKIIAIIIATVIICIMSALTIMGSLTKFYNDKKTAEEQLTRYKTTLSKSDSSLKKLDFTLDSLRSIQSNASLLIDSMHHQLILQREINNTALIISHKNMEILRAQKLLDKKSDDILNPFFPITIRYEVEIPFEYYKVQPLLKHAMKIKTEKQTNDSNSLDRDKVGFAIDSTSTKEFHNLIRDVIKLNVIVSKHSAKSVRELDLDDCFDFAIDLDGDYKNSDINVFINFKQKNILINVFLSNYIPVIVSTKDFQFNDIFGSSLNFFLNGDIDYYKQQSDNSKLQIRSRKVREIRLTKNTATLWLAPIGANKNASDKLDPIWYSLPVTRENILPDRSNRYIYQFR